MCFCRKRNIVVDGHEFHLSLRHSVSTVVVLLSKYEKLSPLSMNHWVLGAHKSGIFTFVTLYSSILYFYFTSIPCACGLKQSFLVKIKVR